MCSRWCRCFELFGRVWRLLAIDKLFAIVLCQLLRRLPACEGARIADIRLAIRSGDVRRVNQHLSVLYTSVVACQDEFVPDFQAPFRSIVLHGLTPTLWHVPRKSEFLAHPSVLQLSLLSLLLVHRPCLFHQLHRCSQHLFWSDGELTGGVRSRATPKSETRHLPCGLQPDTDFGLHREYALPRTHPSVGVGVHPPPVWSTPGYMWKRAAALDFLLHFARLREAQRGAKRSEAMPSHTTPRQTTPISKCRQKNSRKVGSRCRSTHTRHASKRAIEETNFTTSRPRFLHRHTSWDPNCFRCLVSASTRL